MKLNELAPTSTTAQVSRVFESYFEQKVNFAGMSKTQARGMLARVRDLVQEHRTSPAFHRSERNPAYLKLVMLEQALTQRLSEQTGTTGPTPQQVAAMQTAQIQQKRKQINTEIKDLQEQKKQIDDRIRQLQKAAANPTLPMAEGRRALRESEVQQAQVVLAAQDMVDNVQGMIEDATEMQFKELPALVDQIKNQIGPDQAAQFNNDASAALVTVVQSLQSAKQQLDTALGVVTGQAPAAMPAVGTEPMPGQMPPADEPPAVPDLDVEADIEPAASAGSLGRERR